MTAQYALRADVRPDDQRFPCCLITTEGLCSTRASFRITPSCSCVEPVTLACTRHLARVVHLASDRCSPKRAGSHFGGQTARVRPLAGAR